MAVGYHEARVEYERGLEQPMRQIEHPSHWTCDDVSTWLEWCVQEFGLSNDLPNRFRMNGA